MRLAFFASGFHEGSFNEIISRRLTVFCVSYVFVGMCFYALRWSLLWRWLPCFECRAERLAKISRTFKIARCESAERESPIGKATPCRLTTQARELAIVRPRLGCVGIAAIQGCGAAAKSSAATPKLFRSPRLPPREACARQSPCPQFRSARNRSVKTPSSSFRAPA
jgi:hypothetical protein